MSDAVFRFAINKRRHLEAVRLNINLDKFSWYVFIKLPPVLLSRDGTGNLPIQNLGT